jgi:penicillin G amidase
VLSRDKSPVTFGACARHVSNLADPNENYFVLLGGQDGWLNGPYLSDQVALWQAGAYVKVPLTREAVAAWAEQTVTVAPRGGDRSIRSPIP